MKIPDFSLPPWILKQAYIDFLAYDLEKPKIQRSIAHHFFYINEETGEFGDEIRTFKKTIILRSWEKKIIVQNTERTLFYINLLINGNNRQIYRLKSPIFIAEIQRDQQKKVIGFKVIFELVTGAKKFFFLPAATINTI